MLEKMNKRIVNKNIEKVEDNINLEASLELKKNKKEEENFQKVTMLHLIEKTKEEICKIKMEISGLEFEAKNYQKFYEREKVQESFIMDRINANQAKFNKMKNKVNEEEESNNYDLKYFKDVIDQKWSFIHSAEDRKEKQIKLAYEAKNDNQDKEEVEKRKVLSLCFLYNKYLRKKMEKELKDNTLLEETFQTIKDITVK
jgi:hypothetical protein